MCEVAGLITAMSAIVGGLSSFANSSRQQQEAEAAQEYQAMVARNNAKVLQTNAEYAKDIGEERKEEEKRKHLATIGRMKANIGAAGISMNGSPLSALVSEDTNYRYALNTINNDVAREVWKNNVAANNSLNKANYIQNQDTGRGLSPLVNLSNSLLGAGNSLYNAWNH